MTTASTKKPGKGQNGKPTANKKINLHGSLQEYFGFDKFKGNQEKIIESLLAGHDTFVIKPTGGVKAYAINCPPL